MTETVVVILDVSQNFSPAGFENVGGKLFSRGLSGASCDRHHGLIPLQKNAVREFLKGDYSVIDKDQPIPKTLQIGLMLFKSVAP